jgi:hypothetical protein
MPASPSEIWFFGDLNDAWVANIALALPESHGVIRIDCSGEATIPAAGAENPPRLIVMHRPRFVPADVQRLKSWHDSAGPGDRPALIVCVGPYIRYEELERYSGLVDLVLSEATAAEVLPRHAARLLDARQGRAPRGEGHPFRILVASSSAELCSTLAEACAAAGYHAEPAEEHKLGARIPGRNERAGGSETILTIWDVPLSDDWSERLERHALSVGPVVALMGFADRTAVALARSRGAFACLELPLNLDDLIDAIDRFSRSLPLEPPGPPARAEPAHLLPPRPRRRAHDQAIHPAESPWPPPGRPPTIA